MCMNQNNSNILGQNLKNFKISLIKEDSLFFFTKMKFLQKFLFKVN